MGNIEIKAIKTKALKELAKVATTRDDNDKKTLNEKEQTIFKNMVEAAGLQNNDEYKRMFATNPAQPKAEVTEGKKEEQATEVEQPKVAETPEEERDVSMKELKVEIRDTPEAFKRTLATAAKEATTIEEVIDARSNARDAFILKDNEKDIVKEVANLLPKNYKSVKDVDERHDEVLKKLEQAKLNNEEHFYALEILEAVVKKGIAKKEKDELLKKVHEAKAADEKANDEEILDQIVAIAKASGKYDDGFKDAVESYRKNEYVQNATGIYTKAVSEVKNDRTKDGEVIDNKDKTKWKDVRKAAINAIKKDDKWYDGTKEAASKKWFKKLITGKESNAEIIAERQATKNNVEQQQKQSNAEVVDKLGRKFDLALALEDQLVEKRDDLGRTTDEMINLATRDEKTGDWDFTGLIQEIKAYVGTDYILNKCADIDQFVSEVKQFTNQMAGSGVEITETEAKKLIKLCGFDIERKDWREVILETIAGYGVGAGSAAAGEAVREPNKIYKEGDTVENNFKVNINIKKGNVDEIKTIGGDAITKITETSDGVRVLIEMNSLVKYPDAIIKIAKHTGEAALLGGMVTAAAAALNAMKDDKGEDAVGATKIEDDRYENYVKRLGNSPYKGQLAAIAFKFTDKEGNLNKADLEAFLNDSAGIGGKLNKKELTGALAKLETELKNYNPNKQETVEEIQGYVADKQAIPGEQKWQSNVVDANTHTVDARNSSWEKCAELYPCLKDYSYSDRIRIIKIVQGITDNNYSKERLDYLLKESRKSCSYVSMKSIKGFDYTAYHSALKGFPGEETKLPDSLANCKRTKDQPDSINKIQNPRKLQASKSARDYVDNGSLVTIGGESAKFALKVGTTYKDDFKTAEERNAAYKKLQEEYKAEGKNLQDAQKVDYSKIEEKKETK